MTAEQDECASGSEVVPLAIVVPPPQQRQRARAPWWHGTFHLLAANIGIGILALPQMLQTLGWGAGLVWFSFISALFYVCSRAIILCCNSAADGSRLQTYVAVLADSFSRRAAHLLQWGVIALQLGTMVAFLLTVSDNLAAMYTNLAPAGSPKQRQVVWTTVAAIPQLALCLVPSLDRFIIVSVLGALMTLSYLGIAVYLCADMYGTLPAAIEQPGESEFQRFVRYVKVSAFIVFAYGVVSLTPNVVFTLRAFPEPSRVELECDRSGASTSDELEHHHQQEKVEQQQHEQQRTKQEQQRQPEGEVQATMSSSSFKPRPGRRAGLTALTPFAVINISLYLAVMVIGKVTFGSHLTDDLLVTISQHTVTPAHDALITTAQGAIIVHVMVAYQLFAFSLLDILAQIGAECRRGRSQSLLATLAVRWSVVIFTWLIAAAFPFFGDILGVIAALCSLPVSYILPLVMLYVRHRKAASSGQLGVTAPSVALTALFYTLMALLAALMVATIIASAAALVHDASTFEPFS
jgi:amino acid permease